MKTKITTLALIAATALSLAPKPAQASDKGLAVLGGIIGGVIIASALNDGYHDAYPANRGTTVVYNNDRYDDGYWRVVAVNVWVPACWVVERGAYGHSNRRYVGGHYEPRNNRVWVANDRHDRRDYDRRDNRGRDHSRRDHNGRNEREVGSGYGHRR